MKAQADGGGARILLGDSTGDGTFMLRPVRSTVLELRLSTELPMKALRGVSSHSEYLENRSRGQSEETLLLIREPSLFLGASHSAVRHL